MISDTLKVRTLTVNAQDNVAVALTDLEAGEQLEVAGKTIILKENIKLKHKYALHDFDTGDELIMYGIIVGKATQPIASGQAITTTNVSHKTAKVHQRNPRTQFPAIDVSKWRGQTFKGFVRSDGRVGTANYWLVFPLVFCENKNIEIIKDAINDALGYSRYHKYRQIARQIVHGKASQKNEGGNQNSHQENTNPFKNVDGVRFLTHQMGCGGTRQDAQALCGLLAGYLNNPNVAGATVLSLGCQNAQFEILKEEINKRNPAFDKPLYYFDQQTLGSEDVLIETAITATIDGLKMANELERTAAPISKLVIGLECGGSDGFSGISANPVLGRVSDIISTLGGSAVLSEFPELCGVEQELSDRCANDEIAAKFLDLMEKYQNSALAVGSSFDMNPSPGNIKDGLITDAMKSAGAAKKGGSTMVTDVLDYPEPVNKPGLNLLCTPGNDVESTTALAGSGANIILFTTGLGTPTGNPFTPVIKVSINNQFSEKMSDIIDFNTGGVITGQVSIEEAADDLLEEIIQIASGEKKSKAMINEQYDFIPWKRGVSL